VQQDNANVPQPRADEGVWVAEGKAFLQKVDKVCLLRHAFRRSLDSSLRARELNRNLSVQVDVPPVDAKGVEYWRHGARGCACSGFGLGALAHTA
jgi:hypothetical protein